MKKILLLLLTATLVQSATAQALERAPVHYYLSGEHDGITITINLDQYLAPYVLEFKRLNPDTPLEDDYRRDLATRFLKPLQIQIDNKSSSAVNLDANTDVLLLIVNEGPFPYDLSTARPIYSRELGVNSKLSCILPSPYVDDKDSVTGSSIAEASALGELIYITDLVMQYYYHDDDSPIQIKDLISGLENEVKEKNMLFGFYTISALNTDIILNLKINLE